MCGLVRKGRGLLNILNIPYKKTKNDAFGKSNKGPRKEYKIIIFHYFITKLASKSHVSAFKIPFVQTIPNLGMNPITHS